MTTFLMVSAQGNPAAFPLSVVKLQQCVTADVSDVASDALKSNSTRCQFPKSNMHWVWCPGLSQLSESIPKVENVSVSASRGQGCELQYVKITDLFRFSA